MAGGPSQLEMFDYKPKLLELNGEQIPESFVKGKRFAFMSTFRQGAPRFSAHSRKFARHGQCGAWVSEVLPHTAGIVDDISIIPTVATDVFNHAPAKLFINTGSTQFGRPSMGAWVTYGIGSESRDLPGFVVLQSGPRGPRGGAVNWASGLLPSSLPGCAASLHRRSDRRSAHPADITTVQQRDTMDAVRELNLERLVETGDPEIATRIAAYEMAYRMQSSAPELIDISGESPHTLKLYGAEPGKPSSPTIACWPGGWSSGACASCNFITPIGTTTAALARTWNGTSKRFAARPTRPPPPW